MIRRGFTNESGEGPVPGHYMSIGICRPGGPHVKYLATKLLPHASLDMSHHMIRS